MHPVLVILLTVMYLLSLCAGSHFRGGVMYWQTVGPVTDLSNSSTSIIRVCVTQRFAWRRDYSANTYCNETTIAMHKLSGENGFLKCRAGCQSYYIPRANTYVYCTDFSEEEQWMVGERSYETNITVNSSQLEASYIGGDWIGGLVGSIDETWELRLKLDLASNAIKQRGLNGSPISKMSPVVTLLYGCNYTIVIPVVDPDGDTVRCRWANSTLDECGGVCNGFPGAILDPDRCTLTYSATKQRGVYAVAIQVEDFYTENDTVPISSSPLQFLVNVTGRNSSCGSKPRFVPPTPAAGLCVSTPHNSTYSVTIIATPGAPDNFTSIIDITTQSPEGTTKSSLSPGPGEDEWHVNISWTPPSTLTEAAMNIFCFTAIDNNRAFSDQLCFTLSVGSHPPQVQTVFPSGSISTVNSIWKIDFDQPISRPSSPAFIRYYDDDGSEIMTVDTSSDPGVRFRSQSLEFNTGYVFTSNSSYYVTLDPGVALGLEACKPFSAENNDPQFWRLITSEQTQQQHSNSIQSTATTTTTTTTSSSSSSQQAAMPASSPDPAIATTTKLSRVTSSTTTAPAATTITTTSSVNTNGNTESQLNSECCCNNNNNNNNNNDDVILGLLIAILFLLLLLLIVMTFFVMDYLKRQSRCRDDVTSRDSPVDAYQSASPKSTAWSSIVVGQRQSNTVSPQSSTGTLFNK